jgi:endoglucanase
MRRHSGLSAGFAAILASLAIVGFLAYLLMAGHTFFPSTNSTENRGYFSRGINLSGAELNEKLSPAVYGKDYIYPPLQELDYYASKGFSVVRLPYLWERLQPALFGELDEAELGRIKSFVAAAEARDIRIILSPHNFGRFLLNGDETLIGTAGVSIDAFADFSYKVAKAFAGDDAIYALSLMNEPHDSNGMWKQTAQAGLDAIRRADRERLVLAPGDQWSGAWSWPEYNDDFLLNDASDNIMYEAHQYFDIDHSGTYKEGHTLVDASPERGVEWVRPFAQTAPRERDHNRVRRSKRRPAVARTDAATARLFGAGEHPLDLLGRWTVVGRLPPFGGTEERR